MKPRPHADLIHAWADGAQIQVLRRVGVALAWEDIDPPVFRACNEYRIKPEQPSGAVQDRSAIADHLQRIEDELTAIKKQYKL